MLNRATYGNRQALRKASIRGYSKLLKSAGQVGQHWTLEAGKHVYGETSEALTDKAISEQLKEFGLKKYDTPVFRDNWLKHLPHVTPTEFLHGMFGKIHCTEGNFKGLYNLEFSKGTLSVEGEGCFVHGAETDVYSREFDFTATPKVVHHDLLRVKNENQGGGVVKSLLRSAIPLYRKMGIEKVSLTAAMDRGAYAWARYGFNYSDTPKNEGASAHMQWLGKKLEKTVTDPAYLSNQAHEEYKAIKKLIGENSPTRLWHMVDMKTPALDAEFGGDIIEKGDVKPTFVKHLLRDTSYYGSLSLKDPIAMSRLAKYISND